MTTLPSRLAAGSPRVWAGRPLVCTRGAAGLWRRTPSPCANQTPNQGSRETGFQFRSVQPILLEMSLGPLPADHTGRSRESVLPLLAGAVPSSLLPSLCSILPSCRSGTQARGSKSGFDSNSPPTLDNVVKLFQRTECYRCLLWGDAVRSKRVNTSLVQCLESQPPAHDGHCSLPFARLLWGVSLGNQPQAGGSVGCVLSWLWCLVFVLQIGRIYFKGL